MIRVEFDKAVPNPSESSEATICCVVVVSNCTLHHDPSKNTITQVK